MLGLIFMMLVVLFSLSVLFWRRLFTQGYIYSEPEPDLYWRAPVAGAVLTAFLAFWCWLNYTSADVDTVQPAYDTLFRFSPEETKPPVDRLWSVRGEQETLYTRTTSGDGRIEYVNAQGSTWRREDSNGLVEAILIDEGGNKVRFEPRLVQGKFAADAGQYPIYYEKTGRRVMEPIGQLSVTRWGHFFLILFLNFLHLGLWFVCLWLIVRFQWTHALLGAVVIWVVMTLVVLPMLLERSMSAGRERTGSTPSSAVSQRRPSTLAA